MTKPAETFPIVAKTLFGLEQVLADELREIGATDIVPGNRSVSFRGGKAELYDANLRCRTATRILRPLATFRVRGADQLYRHAAEIDWLHYLSPTDTLAVDAVIANAPFDNSMFVAQKTKDAIVDRIRNATGRRPSVDTRNPDLRLNIHIVGSEASLALDSSGDPLSRRGYRQGGGRAPLSEVLAAGILALSGWKGDCPLVDPMCGSGTFVIEAAMIARGIAPGLIRPKFGFMKWKDYDSVIFKDLLSRARKRRRVSTSVPIVAGDIDRRQIGLSRANAERAGVKGDIRFETKPLTELQPPTGPGTVVTNPPYGERLSGDRIESLYHEIGDRLKQAYEGYDAFILTGNLEAAKKIGLRTSRRIQLYNGPIECRLLKFELYRGSRKHD